MNAETRVGTLSIISGSEACNARCPYCVSKMTPSQGVTKKITDINWERFSRAFEYAKRGESKTVMITGKGEPLLFPDQVTSYLSSLKEIEQRLGYQFENIELQTNGISLARKPEQFDRTLDQWKELRLKTISISIAHFDPEINRQIYLPKEKSYIDLPSVIAKLHEHKLRVRLACILVNGFIDSAEKIEQLIDFAKTNDVEELTVRPVNKPDNSKRSDVADWVEKHQLTEEQIRDISNYLSKNGTEIKRLSHGATVYDVDGQNICFANSLTKDEDESYQRQLIFFPNGIISTDWTEEGENLP